MSLKYLRITIIITLIIFILAPTIIQKYKLTKLKVGTIIKVTRGFSKDGDYKGKILAIDKINNQTVYGIKLWKDGEPVFTSAKDGKKINTSSIGHLPISQETLQRWQFEITGSENIQNNELEGYQYWKEVGGGAF